MMRFIFVILFAMSVCLSGCIVVPAHPINTVYVTRPVPVVTPGLVYRPTYAPVVVTPGLVYAPAPIAVVVRRPAYHYHYAMYPHAVWW